MNVFCFQNCHVAADLRRWLGLLIAIWILSVPVFAADDVRRSVVKIEVTRVEADIYEPWKREAPSEASGTGVIIDGNRILTNAHVVNYARSITVQTFGSSTKVTAKVIGMSAGMDLAILSVDKKGFFDERPAMQMDDELPAVRSTVNAYGFPYGGTQISVTEGIVSRIQFGRYYYSSTGLRIQIDAALNPGNSGGPAVKDGRMVGLVFSRIQGGDNIGYLIPVEEIRMFLDDIEDGNYDGKLSFSRATQTLENDAIREKLGLSDDVGGVMISDLDKPEAKAKQKKKKKSGDAKDAKQEPVLPLKPWDVITPRSMAIPLIVKGKSNWVTTFELQWTI